MSATFRVALSGQSVQFRFQNVSFDGVRAIVSADVSQDINARAAKAQNLADLNDRAAATNNLLFLQSGTGAVAQSLRAFLRDIAVTPQGFGAVADGVTDDAPAIRKALATGRPVRFPPGTYVVGPDPASENFGGVGAGVYVWCLFISSNSVLIFDNGATIKGANGLSNWCRVIAVGRGGLPSSNVSIFGELRVDANVANASATTNEHMHGVFLYNCRDSYFERIHSVNARGDNVLITGDNDTRGSYNVTIGSIYAEKAGRKNLVLANFDNIRIGSAVLDNSAGGAAIYTGGVADNTDKHCFDVEPDGFTGANRMEAWIGSLRTYGLGNDFTAGTTETHGENCVVNIGTFESRKSASSTVKAHIQNAITLNIGTYSLAGLAGASEDVVLNYAARLNVDRMEVNGSAVDTASNFFVVTAVGTDKPRINIGLLDLKCPSALSAVRIAAGTRGRIGEIRLRAPVNLPIWFIGTGDSTYQSHVTIGRIDAEDSGLVGANNCVLAISGSGGEIPRVCVDDMAIRDSRGASAITRAVLVGDGMATGFTLKNLKTSLSLTPVGYGGLDTFYSTGGADGGVRQFVCTGTPEGLIAAPVGSTAVRTDGSTSTTLYVKTSGTGNTGWTAK